MPCFHPITAYRGQKVDPASGLRVIVFKASEAYVDQPFKLPCGRCQGCRLERSRVWAVRCMHEASLYQDNCFITLTYAPENMPPGESLDHAYFQKFMKRLRKKTGYKRTRMYMCGEYGEELGRPHFHACLFGFRFPDLKFHKNNANGDKLYTSEILSRLWKFGFATVGDVTWQSASYIARYVMKKVNGADAEFHYGGKTPEYTHMSKGIGKGWFLKWYGDAYPHDDVVMNGKTFKVPRYYQNMFAEMEENVVVRSGKLIGDVTLLDDLKNKRLRSARKNAHNNTPDRLAVREEVLASKLGRLKREL